MCGEKTRDSGSHFHAKMRFAAHSAAATSPGADSPARAANDPTTGPITTPRLVAAEALDETRHEQQPQRPGEPEDQVRQSRCGQPREQGWPPTVAVGHPPPHRRGDELRDGKGCGHQADRRRAGVEVERIQRQQRQDEGKPDHVDERDSHQHRHPLHRLAPSPRTTALTTIRITPNPAATPSSETRRLAMISIEIGRLSGVYSTMDVTKSPSAATNARLPPAASAGLRSGSVTRRNVAQRPAPRLAAASSSAGSSCRYPARTARPVTGRLRTRYPSGNSTVVPTSTQRRASGSYLLNVVTSARANTVPGRAHGSARSASMGPRNCHGRRRPTRTPATSARTTAAKVLAVAIHTEFASGRSRSASLNSLR